MTPFEKAHTPLSVVLMQRALNSNLSEFEQGVEAARIFSDQYSPQVPMPGYVPILMKFPTLMGSDTRRILFSWMLLGGLSVGKSIMMGTYLPMPVPTSDATWEEGWCSFAPIL